MSVEREVTRGVFDPRTYRQDDPVNWARKRRSDWMATTGKIQYVRERIVPSEERELKPMHGEEVAEVGREQPAVAEVRTNVEKKNATEFWPRKMRSDITRTRVI